MMAEMAIAGAGEPSDALEAEEWASGLVGTWRTGAAPAQDVDHLFGVGLVAALEALGGPGALAVLRALGSIGAPPYRRLAGQAGDRMAALGVVEPEWNEGLGTARPVAALLMSEETGFDDGVSVMVEFAAPSGELHTIGAYIDHNLGGLVKDAFVAGPLAGVREQFARRGPEQQDLVLREIALAEARVRVEEALDILDHTLDPPVNADVQPLRALMYARMRSLPAGGTVAEEVDEVTPAQRAQLLADFLDSAQGQRWRGDEDAEDLAEIVIDFGADYNHGGPLRWSPVVVELFMTGWLARRVTRETAFFERVPDVLRDWVAFAGQRRGVPAAAVGQAVAAVERYRQDMLAAVNDPELWGPAKTFAVAAQQAGVNLADPTAVNEFVERYNDGLAA
jgi:hypothetical protein